MTVITISRGSFSKGKEVAEKVSRRLGYRSVSHEVILDASKRFQVPPNRLAKAIHDPPSLFERFFSEKQKYIAYVAARALARFKDDNIVYYGFAGQFFASHVSPMTAKILAYFKNDGVAYEGFASQYYARTIPHLFKVRMVANWEDRIRLLMERESLSRKQALYALEREDRGRNAWSRHFYGVENTDLSLYDLAIHIDKLTVDDVVDIICDTAAKPLYQTTPESRQAMEDLALAAGIKADIFDDYPGCEVVAEGTSVEVYVRYSLHTDTEISDKITGKVLKMPGVSSVSVILIPSAVFT